MKRYDLKDFNCGTSDLKELKDQHTFINCLKIFVFTHLLEPDSVQEFLLDATPKLKVLNIPYSDFAKSDIDKCFYKPAEFFRCRYGSGGFGYRDPTTYYVSAWQEGLHDLRKQLVSADKQFYRTLLDGLIRWFDRKNRTEYSKLKDFNDIFYTAGRIVTCIVLLKIYLGIDLVKAEGEYIADGLFEDCCGELKYKHQLRYLASLQDIGEDPDFAAALPPQTLHYLYQPFADAFITMGYPYAITKTLRDVMDAQSIPYNPLESYFSSHEESENPIFKVLEDFFTGKFEDSMLSLAALRKGKKNNRDAFPFMLELMFQFCRMILTKDVVTMRKEINKFLNSKEEKSRCIEIACFALHALEQIRLGRSIDEVKSLYGGLFKTPASYLNIAEINVGAVEPLIIVPAASLLISDKETRDKLSAYLQVCLHRAIKFTPRLAKIYAKTFSSLCSVPEDLLQDNKFFDFSVVGNNDNAWKIQLDSLNQLLGIEKIISQEKKQLSKGKGSAAAKEKHLIWTLYKESRELVPAVIVFDPDGRMAVSKFFNSYYELTKKANMTASWMTDKDRDIVRSLNEDGFRGSYLFSAHQETFNPKDLVGHEHIYFVENGGDSWIPSPEKLKEMKHVRVVEEKCKMIVTEKNDDWHVTMSYGDFLDKKDEWGFELKGDDLIVRKISKMHHDIRLVLGKDGKNFPKEVFNDLNNWAKNSEIEVCFDVKAEDILANAHITAMFSRAYGSYFLRLRIKPNPNDDTRVRIPGQGEMSLLGHDGIRPLHYVRDPELEVKNAEAVINSISILKEFDEEGLFSYSSESLENILEALEQINAHPDLCSIEWQDGKKMTVSKTVGAQSFKLSSTLNKQNWLSISGEIEIDENRYVSLRSLLDSIDASKGRFVKVNDDNYIALTTDLKKRLEKLKALTQTGKDGELTAHPLASAAFDNVIDGINADVGETLETLFKKRQDAMNFTPHIPKTLQADLRHYQVEGFEWLAKLKKWGVGACLADDMGLGKTVQTIASMLLAAPDGPIMVIAPTSVCPNWEMEIHKFAPVLTVKRLKEADNRKEFIQSVGKNEVLIVSYGLFSIEAGPLSKVDWEMAVFDEAQALKNDLTKRAKTAAAINAKMKIALTGTPIENNLDDLWSIFNVINMGLLGSKQSFHDRFSNVMSDKNTNKILKLLISPFILRRLKSDVLQDLPPRTEQVITVEPTEREKELYETMRLKTCEDLEKNKLPSNKAGQRRLQILAALTKLRQLCCDPALMSPELSTGTSSKTEAFLDLLDEAISGGHRLLVFSQFVGYLDRIRKLLDNKNVSYKYLDGQTPEKKRKEAIAEFQSGEGDVFLISLRAGGQGLNLTGADYVVHLDPWWNPAVEDQATDRAYRIGQTRPVNVFRLVMKNSLEEGILELHAQKRELAADFLTGTSDVAAEAMKLSEEELLNLLA